MHFSNLNLGKNRRERCERTQPSTRRQNPFWPKVLYARQQRRVTFGPLLLWARGGTLSAVAKRRQRSGTPMVRVLIADDHWIFREGLRHFLEAIPDIVITGEAKTGSEAVALTRDLLPDVLLLDLDLPDFSGLEVL